MNLKLIPGTMGFVISEDGRLFDAQGNEKTIFRNGDGYLTANVLTEHNDWVTYGIHRLTMLAHRPIENPEDFVVNHLDLDITNPHVSNLEWVTNAENICHGILSRPHSGRPKILAVDPSGRDLFIDNLAAASEILNCHVDDVWKAIREGCHIKGWSLKHHTTRDKIPPSLHKATIAERCPLGMSPKKKVKLKDVFNGDMLIYETVNEAAAALNIQPSAITHCAKYGERVKLLLKKYVIAYNDEEFRVPSEEDIKFSLNQGPKEVLAHNKVLSKWVIFPSASSFVKETELSRKAVSTTLKADRIRNIGDWVFLYFTAENMKRLKTHVENPVST